MQTEFTKQQLATVRAYLAQVQIEGVWTPDEWVAAMQFWPRADRLWSEVYGLNKVNIWTALWWYQYRNKPGSKEWRPGIIIRALIHASERDYVEPGAPIEPSDAILRATPIQKKRARMMFIREFGYGTYQEKVHRLMRRRGVKALFDAPATSEVKGYVEILAQVASR